MYCDTGDTTIYVGCGNVGYFGDDMVSFNIVCLYGDAGLLWVGS